MSPTFAASTFSLYNPAFFQTDNIRHPPIFSITPHLQQSDRGIQTWTFLQRRTR